MHERDVLPETGKFQIPKRRFLKVPVCRPHGTLPSGNGTFGLTLLHDAIGMATQSRIANFSFMEIDALSASNPSHYQAQVKPGKLLRGDETVKTEKGLPSKSQLRENDAALVFGR